MSAGADERAAEGREARATIVDVARHAGVSKSTVSLVLSGSSLVAEATRERVSQAMSDLGYIYHRGAATLRGAKSGVLGMVINDLVESVLRRDGDRHRGGLPGRRLHPVHRQHRRESRPAIAGHPLDARIWRGGAGAVAGDREFALRS